MKKNRGGPGRKADPADADRVMIAFEAKPNVRDALRELAKSEGRTIREYLSRLIMSQMEKASVAS